MLVIEENILTQDVFFEILNKPQPEFINYKITKILFEHENSQFENFGAVLTYFGKLPIVFKSCHFDVPIISYQGVCLESVIIENCSFNELITISNTVFLRYVSIRDNIFEKDVILTSCQFRKDLYFENNIFNKNLSFDYYRQSRSPEVAGEFNFSNTCNGDVNLNNIFFNISDFRNAKFFGDFIINGCVFDKIALFRNLNLSQNVKFINVDLTNCSFLNSNIKDISFINCNFNYTKIIDERIALSGPGDNLWIQLQTFGMSESMRIMDVEIPNVINVYKLFEINFDNNKEYDIAGEFHQRKFELERINFKRILLDRYPQNPWTEFFIQGLWNVLKRCYFYFQFFMDWVSGGKLCKEKVNARKLIHGGLIKYTLLSLYKLSSSYGENYGRALGLFILSFIIFTFVYLFSGLNFTDHNGTITIFYMKAINQFNFWNDLGLSAIYSLNNVIPFKKDLEYLKAANGWTTFFTILESFILTILASLFVIGLRRKFKR